MAVLMIHHHRHLLDECCDLINMEWPRSKTARMRTLQASCDKLPTSLVLIHNNKVIGHSKVTAIPSIPSGCFIETVVIHPHLRGMGFGKLMMSKTEEFTKSLGLHTVYLSTHDQQGFYKKLGYTECSPPSLYGCADITTSTCHTNIQTTVQPKLNQLGSKDCPCPPPPPPPPPLPPLTPPPSSSSPSNRLCQKKTYMKKDLIPYICGDC